MKDNDFTTLEALVRLPQETLKQTLKAYLSKCYTKVEDTPLYLYAVGNIPITLVAHMDTVFKTPPDELYYDRQKGVMFAPLGAGFDDRAGVFAILKILKAGLRPHVIFTCDEEKGCIGASLLANTVSQPFAEMKYIIELDRRGLADCVFYQCDNLEFVNYVESFGFVENWGSFSDISEICPAWGVAGVNLSVGYMDEHTPGEILYVSGLLSTIDRVTAMLKDAENAPTFEYIPARLNLNFGKYWKNIEDDSAAIPLPAIICNGCKEFYSEYEVIPVKGLDDTTKFYCPDCIASGKIQWCSRCGEACETKSKGYIANFVCEDCKNESKKHRKD
jgi:hypothetical protein